MNTGTKELKSILEELDELKLPHMAAELETLYKQPAFVNTGRLELISSIIHAEYIVTITNRYTSRLKKAKLKGTDSCLDQCVDSRERQYQPPDIVQTLSSLDFVRNGMNLCIFGASDSGKTYLARALGAEACREYRVGYYHCDELVSELAAARKIEFRQYQKKVKAIINLDLVILDDFLLHPITEDDEVKGLYDSRPTISKYYDMDVVPEDPGAKLSKDKVFDVSPFRETIIAILEDNNRNDYCISSVYDVLEEKFIENGDMESLPGNEQTLRNYVHFLEESGQIDTGEEHRRIYDHVFDTPPGEQMLIDFGEVTLTGQKSCKRRLNGSRAIFLPKMTGKKRNTS